MGKKKEVTIGYRYFLGVHFALCHGPADAVTHISVDERNVWSGNNTGGRINVYAEEIFGGEKREGGISGAVDFLVGSSTQLQNDYLVAKLGAGVPAYRRIASMVLRQTYMGTNPYMKKWAFRVRRIMQRSNGSPQWYSAKAAIGQDMNPAHIIYECLTDNDWGMGYSTGDINETTFTACADTLYSEGFGLSILWEKEASIEDFIKEIVRHIDAALYVDKATGKFTMKLIRADYTVANLKVFDESNVVKVDDFVCSTFTELINTVTLNYWDASTGRTSSTTVQDIALVQLQGATVSQTQEYGGITQGALAAKVASRDLKALSSPMVRCTITTTRSGASLSPGEAVVLDWPDYGVSGLVMRVAMIEFGSPTDTTVKVMLVQDVFSLGTATYAAPAATEWVSPVSDPLPATNRVLLEAPYYALVRAFGDEEVADKMATLPSLGVVMSAAARPTSDAIAADQWVDSGAGYQDDVNLDFCPYGVCAGAVGILDASVTLSSSADFYSDMITVGDYALIDTEMVEITSFTSTTLGIKRGVLDTVPATHSAGAKVYVLSKYNGIGQTEYVSGETVNVKLRTQTGKGVLALASAPASSLTFDRRAFRPYPPGQWKIAGNYYPVQLLDTPVSTTWAHRDRLQQTGASLVDFTEGSIGPEAGTTYSLRLYNHDTSNLLYTVDSLTGASHSGFPSPTGHFNMRMELWSARDGYASKYKHSHVFDYYNVTYVNDESLNRLVTEDGAFQLTTE